MARKKQRKISKLKSVTKEKSRPVFIPNPSNLTSVQKAGLAYERQTAKYLKLRYGTKNVLHGSWWAYEDAKGASWCSPDIIIDIKGKPLIVVECKLTLTKSADSQLKDLYVPVLFHHYQREVRPVQVAKNFRKKWKGTLISTWEDLYEIEPWSYSALIWRKI